MPGNSIMRPLTHWIGSPLMKRIFYVLTLAAAVAAPVQAETQEQTLANGLRVIVKTDRRAPVVVSQVWYRAGSMDESYGSTGVAHVLEHMMFKGTQDVPAGEFSKRIAAAGGRENAFTSRDHTAYFQSLQKDRLELAQDVLARMKATSLPVRPYLICSSLRRVSLPWSIFSPMVIQ